MGTRKGDGVPVEAFVDERDEIRQIREESGADNGDNESLGARTSRESWRELSFSRVVSAPEIKGVIDYFNQISIYGVQIRSPWHKYLKF